MPFKRLIVLLVVIGAVAAAIASLAAGSGGRGRTPARSGPSGSLPSGLQRSPALDSNETENYWTPARMKSAKPVPIGIPGGPSQQPSPAGGDGNSAPSHP
jgi:hypothetical protein